MTPGMGRGRGGMSHAGSWGLRDQRNQLGRRGRGEEWSFQVFKAFRPSSVHRTHCTARIKV